MNRRRLLLLSAVALSLLIEVILLYRDLTETVRQMAMIDKYGGTTTMKYEGPGWSWIERYHYLHVGPFHDITQVFFGSPPEKAKGRLQDSMVRGTRYANFSDQDLKSIIPMLETLQPLERFGLTNCKVTNSGMKWLANLRGIESLYLIEMQVTDACLQDIRKVRGLKQLVVDECDFTSEGLAKFAKETGVEVLD